MKLHWLSMQRLATAETMKAAAFAVGAGFGVL